jgi:hypothetical protein
MVEASIPFTVSYYRARYYDPIAGRFESEDATGFAAGIDFYAYAMNSPALLVDPSGLDTVIIITRGSYGGLDVGDHSALMIDSNASGDKLEPGPVLYDPAGSYENATRGSGGVFQGADANLDAYIRYQKQTGSTVYTYRFKTTSAEEAQIAKRLLEQGDPRGFTCALSVSGVLKGVGPFANLSQTRWPGSLQNQLIKAKDDFFLEEQHRILYQRLTPKPPIMYYTH